MQLDDVDPKTPDRASLARALGELEAAKGRVERDAKLVASETRKQLVSELLPVLDSVDRAIAAGEPTAVAGMQLVRRQLEAVLRGYGVERIDATGHTFDPQLHDAVATVPVADAEQNRHVLDQVAPGYRFNGALLRPAKVVVGTYEVTEVVEPEPAVVPIEPAAIAPQLDPRFFRQPFRGARPLREPMAPFRIPHRGRRW